MFKLIGLLGLIGFTALVLLKLFPLYMTQLKVSKAVKTVQSKETYTSDADRINIQKSLEKQWDIETIDAYDYREIKFARDKVGAPMMVVDYQGKAPLFGNISILVDYKEEFPLKTQ